MPDFSRLKVWREGAELTLDIYRASKAFPREEMYGLTSQTPASVCFDRREYCRGVWSTRWRDVSISSDRGGSASEVEYHVLLARDLELLQSADFQRLTDEVMEVKRMLASLLQKAES